MRLNFPDYTKLVSNAYKEKRANNELSPLLAQSTPANIRRECLNVYQERYHKKDEQVLRAFFGPAEQGRQFLQSIRGFETDKFKPLDNYLKGNTEKTDDKNVELLAWLIDFHHRPYVFDKNVLLSVEELSITDPSTNNRKKEETESAYEDDVLPKNREESGILLKKESVEDAVKKTGTSIPLNVISKGNTEKNKSKRAAMILLILIICAGGIYAIWQQEKGKGIMKGSVNSICVYWASDHYEQVPCNEETKGRIIIPMNPERVRSFRRITREDTISEWSVGRLYYIKDSNTIKYYTEAGNYPEDLNRNLKVLSHYIFDNHIRKKETAGKDSLAEQNTKFFK